jgi:hypothetical protein
MNRDPLKRSRELPLSGEQFDPRTAAPKLLRDFGIPPRPDRAAQPRLSSIWESIFLRRLHKAPLEQKVDDSHSHGFRKLDHRAPEHTGIGNLSWSGAVLPSLRAEPFTFVAGFWNVPRPYPPPAAKEGEYRSSAWVGLDGWNSAELPQIGTAQVVEVNKDGFRSETYSWWQWWAKDNSGPPVRIESLPVAPGDLVFCCVSVVSPCRVQLFIQNQSKGQSAAIEVEAPGKSTVAGTTAEWIVERPRDPLTQELFPLPQFGSVVFQGAAAGTSRGEQFLTGATLLDMYDGALLSTAVWENRETLRVSYADNGPPA